MAEALLLTVVRGVAGKAANELVQRVTRMWGVDGHRRKLERHLVYVQSLLADAEAKSETNPAISAWMRELKVAAYQADDVLDNFQYEALRLEAMRGQPMASKVLSNFSSKNQLLFRYKVSRDLKKVLDKINNLVVEMNMFGLVALKEVPAQALSRQTHSALDESMEVVGRDDDKEAVVKLLLDKQDLLDVQVLPIIGMGGLGKTTLAKMVYNDQRIQKHFELKIWYCVPDNFEATAVVRAIIQLATKETCDLPDNIELLRGKLQETIGKKRFLLVLDDVWNEEQRKWDDDLRPLLCSSNGGSGSRIVVTSRNQQVANIMGTLPHHELSCLSEGDSWKLFSKRAFNSKGEQEQLVTIGKRIANRCKGLPLALKTMGGLMSSMHQVHEWETIAKSNVGDTVRGNEVLSILKLSYRHLSSEMKQCFAFCALFPKDYDMEKDKLIQLWMANGYIHEEGNMDLAKKGELIFSELAWRSFLQDVNVKRFFDSGFRRAVGCKMHDLMHDLAKDVTDECALAQELSQKKASIEDVRHLQLPYSYESEDISELLKGTSYLRTLVIEAKVNDLKDLRLMSLRALSYQGSSIIHRQLINTAHLRYLDLSWSGIVRLPSSVCTLYQLQSLRLEKCYRLRHLPEGISNLRKLSHLYLLECNNLECMPPKLSLLQNLRTLTKFIVGTGDGFGIEELKDLRHLGYRLELYRLRKVKSGSNANLHEKQNLSELLLYWGRGKFYNPTSVDASNDEQVLESLAPHPQGELKLLEVHGYGGLAIPHWMKDPQIFLHLKELTISHCPGCIDLPIVWVSSCLEQLSLSYMNSLTTLCRNIDVDSAGYNTPVQMFRKLKGMKLWHLPELERWAQNSAGEPSSSVMFPMLEELSISHCGKLASPSGSMLLGTCPSLVRLEIGLLAVADVAMPLEDQQNQGQKPLETLRHLNLQGDDGFASIFNHKLQLGLGDCLAFVEVLRISECCDVVRWPVEELKRFPCLRSLLISYCTKLEGKGTSTEEILPLPQLKSLDISFCHSLMAIPMLPESLERIDIRYCESLEALPSNLGNLVNLRDLNLRNCDELKALPGGLTTLESLCIYQCPWIDKFPQDLLQKLPSLKYLRIDGCPDLQRRCRQGGEYFGLVSTIQNKHIPFPATSSNNMKKVLKKLLPSC